MKYAILKYANDRNNDRKFSCVRRLLSFNSKVSFWVFLSWYNQLPTIIQGCYREMMNGQKTKTEVSQLLEIFDTFGERSNVTKWNLFSFRNGVLRASYLPLKILFDSKSKRIHPEPIKNARWIRVCGKKDKQCEKSCKGPRRNNN